MGLFKGLTFRDLLFFHTEGLLMEHYLRATKLAAQLLHVPLFIYDYRKLTLMIQ